MNKYLVGFLISFLFLTNGNAINQKEEKSVEVVCNLETHGKDIDLFLMTFDGFNFKNVKTFSRDGSRYFLSIKKKGFYYISTKSIKNKKSILILDDKVEVKGEINRLKYVTFLDEINIKYNEAMAKIQVFNKTVSNAQRLLYLANNDKQKQDQAIQVLAQNDKDKLALLADLKKVHPVLEKYFRLYTYLSYQNNKNGFDREVDHFGKTFFGSVDFKDKVYHDLPLIFDAFQKYSSSMVGIRGLKSEQMMVYFDFWLNKMDKISNTKKMALSGILAGSQSKNSEIFVKYGNQLVEMLEDGDAKKHLKEKIENIGRLEIGGEAPMFSMADQNGNDISLKNYRGNVVLLDFWASWCGPCRKENPNVLRLYKKYKDDGFQVLGISLDGSKSRWLAAIEKDGLVWDHVSDLKKWGNAASNLYNVRSIPSTFLLDKDGKIIAKNLRGPSLENALKNIYGH